MTDPKIFDFSDIKIGHDVNENENNGGDRIRFSEMDDDMKAGTIYGAVALAYELGISTVLALMADTMTTGDAERVRDTLIWTIVCFAFDIMNDTDSGAMDSLSGLAKEVLKKRIDLSEIARICHKPEPSDDEQR